MKRNTATIALGHVGLNVSDIDVSRVFYQEVLGFTTAHESIEGRFRYACFAREGRVVLTLWERTGKRLKRHRPGLHHVAFEAGSIEEMNRTKGLLDNLGMRWSEGALGCSRHPGLEVIYFEDPDGIRIEVYCAAGARACCQKPAAA
jgi:lactoylglutathione lyase